MLVPLYIGRKMRGLLNKLSIGNVNNYSHKSDKFPLKLRKPISWFLRYFYICFSYVVCANQCCLFYYILMLPPTTDSCGEWIMFPACPSVRACLRASEHALVSTITAERVKAFWPNLTQMFSTTVRRTDYVSKVEGSCSSLLQGQIFQWVIAAGDGIYVDASSSK